MARPSSRPRGASAWLGQEVQRAAGVELRLALPAPGQQLPAACRRARDAAARPGPARPSLSTCAGAAGHGGRRRSRRSLTRLLSCERASSSAGCSTGSSCPSSRVCAGICSAQPGLAATTASAPVASRFVRLAPAELARPGLGLEQVVDARPTRSRSPTRRARRSSSPGMRAQQLARLLAHALGVGQVAGVVVGHAHAAPAGARRAARARPGSRSRRATLSANACGALGPLGVVAQQVAVVLHRRAAAGGVDHDPVEALERLDRRSRARGRACPRRRALQRAAAAAGRGRPTSQPSAASRRTVAALTLAEEHALDAALQRSPRCRATGALGGTSSGSAWRAALAGRSMAPGAPAERREAVSRGAPGAAPSAHERRQPAQPPGVGEQREDRAARAAARASGAASCARPAPRVSSISLSYCTPDGHAVTQAMQPRQLSRCSTIGADSGDDSRDRRPSARSARAGESASSPQSA